MTAGENTAVGFQALIVNIDGFSEYSSWKLRA